MGAGEGVDDSVGEGVEDGEDGEGVGPGVNTIDSPRSGSAGWVNRPAPTQAAATMSTAARAAANP